MKYRVLLSAILFILFYGKVIASDTTGHHLQPVDYIDPTIGNVGWLLEPTRPTVQLPNQLIRFTPQRKDFMDDQISSFPLTIVSHRLGQVFALKPSLGEVTKEAWRRKMTYDHDLEVNKPWYYSTWLLDEGIQVEFTPGRKTGYFRFHFPKGTQKSLLFDVYNNGESEWNFLSEKEIAGVETYNGDIKIYTYGVFSQAGTTGVPENDPTPGQKKTGAKGARAYISFPANVEEAGFKYAISYISAAQAKKNFERRQAVAVTLGTSYDDWALSQLAGDLGKKDDQASFAPRGENYRNLWNKDRGFFLPKDDKGQWIDIDTKFDGGPGGRDYYDENNGWTYLWQVQQNIPGLIELMGGKKNLEDRLDQLFREGLGRSKQDFWNKFPDATGLVGQHSMGNEPSFHIPYLYNFTGSPWKTQEHTRFLLSTWFKDNIFGIPGDEDGGGMSAFVVFTSMGFYPITPGRPEYTIGSPVFKKITIALDHKKPFTLIAHDCSTVNKYIQKAKLNGRPLLRPAFTHQDLVNGGLVELFMGPKPNKNWGVQ